MADKPVLSPNAPDSPADRPALGLPVVPREYLVPFILLASCFAAWGLANNLTDTLLAAFRRIMSMSDFHTSWIQIAFYGSYFCLAFPAALFIQRTSYKAGVLLGLALFSCGALLFYPASLTMNYTFFLVALFVLAGGCSILETSSNPYVIVLGPEETATHRLNLAQAFNPIGSITGVLIGKFFILSHLDNLDSTQRAALPPERLREVQAGELGAVMAPYVTIAVILVILWIVIAVKRFPTGRDAGARSSVTDTLARLMGKRHYVAGVIAQFFYVGAQIGAWSFTIRYVMHELGTDEAGGATYYLASIILFSASRFICTGLMKVVAPHVLLWALAAGGIALSLVAAFVGGLVGVLAVVGISGCMSLMFPTIYGLAIHGLGEDTKIAASGLIMAILGGAVLTAFQGWVSDNFGINLAFLVVGGCFVVVGAYGLWFWKADEPAAA